MSLSLTWGGSAMVLPDGNVGAITLEERPLGRSARMHDGSLRVQRTAWKYRITIRWTGLTPAEWTSFVTALVAHRDAVATLVLPDSSSFSVIIADDPVNQILWFDVAEMAIRDTVTVVFEQV